MPTLLELTGHVGLVEEKKAERPRARPVWTVAEAIQHLSRYPMDDLVVSMVVVPRKKKEPDDAA